ncbi:hypothetical protein SLEP1_g47452 [Rubroshorea leprosula]|uniref:RING-type E3 ubiquitin transferase n=1 Tax=Rubroshorea leprosula TaxID=152421 RepID=A0AAV5LQJ8_9ROSI|nr:hypothetical protein SLEP1_g47452 [Rubroshorea leprosula]
MMNSSTTIGSSENIQGKFVLTFGISLGILVLILIIIIMSYLCTCKRPLLHPSHRSTSSSDDQDSVTIELGLDESNLLNYCPKLLYSQAKLDKGDSMASSCSICLAEYKEDDMLRLLPDCDHIFHVDCVDPWLRLHPTCPICRHSSIPPAEIAAMTRLREISRPWFTPFMR